MANATSFGYRPIYYLKLALIFFGVLTLLPIRTYLANDVSGDAEVPRRLRPLAACSLLLWAGVVATGRLIAYVY